MITILGSIANITGGLCDHLTNTRIITWIINQDDSCELQLPSMSWAKVSAMSILACSVNIGIAVVKGPLILVMSILGLHNGSNQLKNLGTPQLTPGATLESSTFTRDLQESRRN